MKNIIGVVRRCADDYGMIRSGDRIAVGVSGGKDSVTLLYALAKLRAYYPKPFELTAVTLSMGLPGMDFTPIRELCGSLGVPYVLKETRLADVIFEERKEKNPCALCSKMRRGSLNDALTELGITKLALGHHLDDAVETFYLSLFYGGRITCFQPVTYMSRSGVTQIRPLLYARERDVAAFAAREKLPVVKSTCPMDGASRRQEIKELIARLERQYPALEEKTFGAMQILPLPGWALPGKETGTAPGGDEPIL